MTAVLEARQLGRRYRRRWALADCTLSVPAGRITGLVGPNGAGKTTLLHLATGLLRPTTGTIKVLGGLPGASAAQRSSVGFVAQDSPVYPGLSVADHLTFGAQLNPSFDRGLAARRIERLGLDPGTRAGKLSGGQRAQLALTLALGKRPRLLLLDEPAASLDPLARRDFLRNLADAAAEHQLSVVMSTHLVGDLAQVCDYLIVLAASKVQIAGDVGPLLGGHRQLTAGRSAPAPAGAEVISAHHDGGMSTLIVRSAAPIADPTWTDRPASLEDVVLAYMSPTGAAHQPDLEVTT